MLGIKKNDLYFIIKAFFVWRILLIFVQFISFKYLPLQQNFLGGGSEIFQENPYFWSYINFDGEHLLSIAQNGYRDLQYFFFPLYPLVSGFIAKLLGGGIFKTALTGLIISHICLFISLLGIFKLLLLKKDDKNGSTIAKQTILLIFLFPTSYYFVSYYSESLFIALSVWGFYFAKQRKWIIAFLLSGLATGTRVVGLALFAGVLTEYVLNTKVHLNINVVKISKAILLTVLGVSGIIVYMHYLSIETGDPLYFFSNVGIYGDQRTAGFVLLPQVFYRYVFKIMPNINYSYVPTVFTTWLEFMAGLVFGIISGIVTLANFGIKRLKKFKLNWGYLVFSLASYIIPTLSGSFSSLPRYVLVIFPLFIIFAKLTYKYSFKRSVLVFSVLSMFVMIFFSLFLRGYWVS